VSALYVSVLFAKLNDLQFFSNFLFSSDKTDDKYDFTRK
jgi:hypothetical protein